MGPGEKLVAAAVRRPLVFFGLFALLALVAGAAESGRAFLRSRSAEPGLGARWIWAEHAARAGMPITLYAARDFELDESTERAWLSIAADEHYVLWLNGQAIGSGSWQKGSWQKGSWQKGGSGPDEGEPVADLYELSDWLETGTNRLVVELRSTSGAGGLLATLRLGEKGTASLVTDNSWRLFRRADPRLLRGLAPLEKLGGETPKIWPWPPIGRWRIRNLEARPVLVPADTFTRGARCARRLGFPAPDAPWADLKADPGCGLPLLSVQSLWDFGETVEGILEFGLDPTSEPAPALLYFLDQDPGADLSRLEPSVVVPGAPGAWLWRDTAVRRFRFLAIVGLKPQDFLRLRLLSAEEKEAYPPPPPPDGVFGLTPPDDRMKKITEMVWQRLAPAP